MFKALVERREALEGAKAVAEDAKEARKTMAAPNFMVEMEGFFGKKMKKKEGVGMISDICWNGEGTRVCEVW